MHCEYLDGGSYMRRRKWALLAVLLGMMVIVSGCFGGGSSPTGSIEGVVWAPVDQYDGRLFVKNLEPGNTDPTPPDWQIPEDSTTYRRLPKASVTITGATSVATTDSNGYFRIDGVRVGEQILTIKHDLYKTHSFRAPIVENQLTKIIDPIPLSGKGYYLLIGVGEFGTDYWKSYGYMKPSSLTSVKTDVDVMERAFLLDNAFQAGAIARLVNSQATVNNVLSQLRQLVAKMEANDYLVIYFSGHGVGGDEYLTTHRFDAIALHDDFLGDWDLWDYISMQFRNRGIPIKDVTLILDACNSGSFADGKIRPVTQKAFRKSGYTVIASSRPEQESSTHPKVDQGLFTYHAEIGLAQNEADNRGNRDGVITASELYAYVRPKVKQDSLGDQEVYIWQGANDPVIFKAR